MYKFLYTWIQVLPFSKLLITTCTCTCTCFVHVRTYMYECQYTTKVLYYNYMIAVLFRNMYCIICLLYKLMTSSTINRLVHDIIIINRLAERMMTRMEVMV